MEAQTGIGVARPRLLTRAEAGRIADRLTTMADGRVAAFQKLKRTYGDLYPALLTELGDRTFGGLPPKLRVLGSVTGSDAPAVLASELDQALAMGRDGSNKTPADGVPAHIAATVRSRLAPILSDDTDPDTRRDNQALTDAAIALVRHRVANGDDPATAARFAVEDLTGLQAVRDDFSLLPDPADEDDDAGFDEDDPLFDEEDDDGMADALLEEFREFRDLLVDDGIDPEAPIVGSVDALKDAIARRDPDEIEARIGQFEDRLNQERTRLTDKAATVQLASLDGIMRPQANPQLLQLLNKGLKQLDKARRFLRNLGRGLNRGDRGQRLPNPDQPNENGVIIPKPPTTPDKLDPPDDQKALGTGSKGQNKEGSLEKSELDARAEGRNIQSKLGLFPSGDVDKIGQNIAQIAEDKFQKTKKSKVVLTMSEIGADANEQSAIQGLVNMHRVKRLTPNNDSVVSLNLGPVDPGLVRRVKVETGIDLSGLQDTIDTGQIDHVFGGHGPGNEKDSGQIPVSSEAIATYRHVVRNFDRITNVRRGKGAGMTLRFEKDINGVAVVVQQVRRGKEEFAFFTMFIKRRGN